MESVSDPFFTSIDDIDACTTPYYYGHATEITWLDQILHRLIVPFVQRIGGNVEYQEDNARLHQARVAIDFMRQQSVNRD